MVAIEVSVNGRIIYTTGVGEFGMLTTELMWARIKKRKGGIHEEMIIQPRGHTEDGEGVLWSPYYPELNDTITIRFVETETCDHWERVI